MLGELPGIAFSAIPKETVVAHSFMDIVEIFKHNYFKILVALLAWYGKVLTFVRSSK